MTVDADLFVRQFFGDGNQVLPEADFEHANGPYVMPYVAPLQAGLRRPLILPRQLPSGRTDAYVICWDLAQATSMRAMIEAFVAHSIVAFDGRTARLSEQDPIEAAILALVGAGTTFVLRPSNRPNQRGLWRTLPLLRDLLSARPERTQAVPRPLGRMLAEFNAALAAGSAASSADLLEEMICAGGLSPLNLAYLRVHRLGRLGRDAELLRLPDLDDVMSSRPPLLVRDAALAAWCRTDLDGIDLGSDVGVAGAVARASHSAHRVAAIMDGIDVDRLSIDARTGAAVVSLLRRDVVIGSALLHGEDLPEGVRASLAELVGHQPASAGDPPLAGNMLVSPADNLSQETRDSTDRDQPTGQTISVQQPSSWSEWGSLVAGTASGWEASIDDWPDWPAPFTEDAELARALESVGGVGAEHAWSMVGPFLDADDMGRPAWRSAGAFLMLAASYDRWAPADLAGIQALLEVFTRGGPPAEDYGDALEMIGGSAPRWASVSNVLPTLDMADLLVRSPCSDPEARLRFAVNALEPLNRHRWRLGPDLLWIASKVADEIGLDLDWSVAHEEQDKPTAAGGPITVLLYSLDEGALRRTAAAVAALVPQARVHTSANRVGSDQLRSQVRSADAVALATRCAKHAATGFIRQNVQSGAVVTEADGAGSASLLRAAVASIHSFIG